MYSSHTHLIWPTHTSASSGDNLRSNDIDEHYGRRKVAIATTNEFRDLLNAYKQTTAHPTKELYTPFKSDYSANESKEGQNSNNQQSHHHQYSPDYGFPTKAIVFKSATVLKESATTAASSPTKGDEDLTASTPHRTTWNKSTSSSSKYQSQSTNNRLVKQLSSSPKTYTSNNRPNADAPKYKDDFGEFDLPTPTNEMRKGALASNSFDDDDLDDAFNAHSSSKRTKSNHLHGRSLAKANLNEYDVRPGRSTNHHQNKSMNRNLKLYSTGRSSTKSAFLDNYHETGQFDEEFFKSKSNAKNSDQDTRDWSKPTGRQLSNRNLNRDFKSANSDDYEDDFFDEQSDDENAPPPPSSPGRIGNGPQQKSTIKHSGRSNGPKSIATKSSRKLIRPPLISKFVKDDETADDDLPNGEHLHTPTNYETTGHDTHHRLNENGNNYLNKNQLNFRAPANSQSGGAVGPRSVLVKTSSYSFEIPNHSENEEVEFDSDHIGKQHKIRPSYTLDRKSTSPTTGLAYSNKALQTTPQIALPDYDLKTPTRYGGGTSVPVSSRTKVDHTMKKTEKQQKQHFSIESNSLKSNLDDDSVNQFDIRRQPNQVLSNNRNHHLPHSHIEDVEAYYKAAKKSNSKGKFRQFFHQQELKHKPGSNSDLKSDDADVRFKSSSSKLADDFGKNVEPVQRQPIDNNGRFVGSPVSKPPRFFFNWHSSINHNSKQPAASMKSKTEELDGSNNDFNDEDENDNLPNVNNDLNKLRLNHQHNYNTLKPNLNSKNSKNGEHGLNGQTNTVPMNTNRQRPINNSPLDDDWFKQDWLFKDLNQQLNQQHNPQHNQQQHNQQHNQPPNHQPSPPQSPKPMKTENNNLENNDIDSNSGDVEYEDDPMPVNNQQQTNQPNKENQINAKTRLQVMDQQNKQYTPTTTTSSPPPPPPTSNQPPETNQASSKNTIPTAYRTKFLSSSKFAERQKFKNSLKTTAQPPTTSTTTTTSSPPSTPKVQTGKKHDYQKAKLINLQFKKDSSSPSVKKPESSKLPFTRTTMKQQQFDKQSPDKQTDKSEKQSDKPNSKASTTDDQTGKKVIMNANLQNSSSTLNAQILEKLPISVDSIFDTIDEETLNEDYETTVDQPAKRIQNKKGDLPEQDNSNESNENALNDDLATNLTSAEQFGTRITGSGGKLQPKVSIKASYSSVSSTIPRAMAQKMDTQKVDSIGFRTLDSGELSLKKESNGLFKNRIKQFKKQNWLSPLTRLQQANNRNSITTTTTTTSSLTAINTESVNSDQDLSKDQRTWKGLTTKQQKLIEQKKNLDDKSIRKNVSPYLSKFRKELKYGSELNESSSSKNELNSINTTTFKSTATTVPTTTTKSISVERADSSKQHNPDKPNLDRFKSLNRFKMNKPDSTNALNSTLNNDLSSVSSSMNKTDHYPTTTVSAPLNQFKTNYNLSFNNNVGSIKNSTSISRTSSVSQNSSQNNNNSISEEQTKPYKRIFNAMSAGTILSHKSRN